MKKEINKKELKKIVASFNSSENFVTVLISNSDEFATLEDIGFGKTFRTVEEFYQFVESKDNQFTNTVFLNLKENDKDLNYYIENNWDYFTFYNIKTKSSIKIKPKLSTGTLKLIE